MAIKNINLTSAAPVQDWQLEEQKLQRQRQLAQALQQQKAPQGGMVGGYYIQSSPLEGAANLINALKGKRREAEVDRKQQELSKNYNQSLTDALKQYGDISKGTPEQITPLEYGDAHPGGRQQVTPAVAGDQDAAIRSLIGTNHPTAQQLGFNMLTSAEQYKQRQLELQQQLANAKELKESPGWDRPSDQSKNYFVPVQTANGVVSFDARRGTGSPLLVDKQPVIGSQSDPSLQQKISSAKEYGQVEGQIAGQENVKKPQQAKNAISLLDQAEDLVDKSTGSGVGTAVDKVAGVFGKATAGGEAVSQLKVIQAGLMLSMPRMEGPQSDRDTQLYREAAGMLGDSSTPNKYKKAAIKTIREIQQRYVDRSSATPSPSDNSSPDDEYEALKRKHLSP